MGFFYSFLAVSGLLGSALSTPVNPIESYHGPYTATLEATETTTTSISTTTPPSTFPSLPSTLSTTTANTTSSCVHFIYPHFNALSSDTCTYYNTTATETAYTDCGGCQLKTMILGAGPVVHCAATTTADLGTSTITACAAATTTPSSPTHSALTSSAPAISMPPAPVYGVASASSPALYASAPVSLATVPSAHSSALAGPASYPVPMSLPGYGGAASGLVSAVPMPSVVSSVAGYGGLRCKRGRC